MNDGKIHLKGRKREHLGENSAPIIRVSREAYNTLVDLVNESSESMSNIASTIILEGSKLVVFDR